MLRASRRSVLRLIGLVAATVVTASTAYALPGDLDTGFGVQGHVVRDFGRDVEMADMVMQPDGKMVLVGGAVETGVGGGFVVARYLPDGRFDPAFTGGGYAFIEVPVEGDLAAAVAMQGNRIVVVGQTEDEAGKPIAAIVRLTPGGGLDPTFGGGDGIVTHEIVGDHFSFVDVAVQTDGRIVAVGNGGDLDDNSEMRAVRLLANGAIDAGFGTGGMATVGIANEPDLVRAVVVQPDGRIVLGGETLAGGSRDFAVARLEADGDPDGSFGTMGVSGAPFDLTTHDGIHALALQPNGTILAAGYHEPTVGDKETAAARFEPNGGLDETFSDDGKFSVDLVDARQDEAKDVVVHTGGTVLLGGYTGQVSSNEAGTLVRLTSGGAMDGNFSGNGIALADFESNHARFESLGIRPDGSIMAAVNVGTDGGPLFFGLARYRDRAASAVILDTTKTRRKIKATGEVVPESKSGQKVTVTYFKKKAGRWKRLARKTLTLDGSSAYATTFRRVSGKRCRVDVAYGGDALHRPSRRSKRFAC